MKIELEHDMGIILLFLFCKLHTHSITFTRENIGKSSEVTKKWHGGGGWWWGGKWLKGLTSFQHVRFSLSLRLLLCKKLYNFCSMVLKPCRCCSG